VARGGFCGFSVAAVDGSGGIVITALWRFETSLEIAAGGIVMRPVVRGPRVARGPAEVSSGGMVLIPDVRAAADPRRAVVRAGSLGAGGGATTGTGVVSISSSRIDTLTLPIASMASMASAVSRLSLSSSGPLISGIGRLAS
jgi:hypothetical protein